MALLLGTGLLHHSNRCQASGWQLMSSNSFSTWHSCQHLGLLIRCTRVQYKTPETCLVAWNVQKTLIPLLYASWDYWRSFWILESLNWNFVWYNRHGSLMWHWIGVGFQNQATAFLHHCWGLGCFREGPSSKPWLSTSKSESPSGKNSEVVFHSCYPAVVTRKTEIEF